MNNSLEVVNAEIGLQFDFIACLEEQDWYAVMLHIISANDANNENVMLFYRKAILALTSDNPQALRAFDLGLLGGDEERYQEIVVQ